MRKYLDSENASIEVDIKDLDKAVDFYKNNIDDVMQQNFKRIIVNIDENDINKFLENIVILDDVLLVIQTFLTKDIDIDESKSLVIFNKNTSKIFKKDYIYNILDYAEEKQDSIIKDISDGANVVLNLKFDSNINKTIKSVEKFLEEKNPGELGINNFMIPSFLMREHPCNAYLCNGWKCKQNMSALPKYIYVDESYNVYPHDLRYEKLLIGNVKKCKIPDLLENYYMSDNYNCFISYAKKVFIKYAAKYPYNFFPIVEFIRMEIENEK